MRQLADAFRSRGLPLTVQRRAVFEDLLARTDHPTADQVHDSVRSRMPGMSRTTVYRVLEALVRLGSARRVCHFGPAVRYDANIGRHDHLVCSACDRVIDVEADVEPASGTGLAPARAVAPNAGDAAVGPSSDCPTTAARPVASAVPPEIPDAVRSTGFRVTDSSVVYRGLCRECSAARPAP